MPKSYQLHQSPLFKIKGRGQFEKIIGINWDAADDLISPDNYNVWITKNNNKAREIQNPHGYLKFVHIRIANLLKRIDMPDYLYSQKGRSYVDNAMQHIGSMPLIKTDINSFYPSTTWQMVYRLFKFDFKCAEDISYKLADICCYRQKHLPTGSPLSGYISFFAAKKMFDEIANLVATKNCDMTVYVDDITVSGQGANSCLLWEIRKIIRKHGFEAKRKKSIIYTSNSVKTVTGVIIVNYEPRLPNKQHFKILKTRQAIQMASSSSDIKKLNRTLKGQLQQAGQIIQRQVS
jgi:hypothetical protein